jgi:hypothetical protein
MRKVKKKSLLKENTQTGYKIMICCEAVYGVNNKISRYHGVCGMINRTLKEVMDDKKLKTF